MSKIRTAVIGLNMGYAHAYAYSVAEKSDLRYVVDLDEKKAAETAKELGCNYTSDWKSILDEVDAISIATPHHLHYPMAMEAISRNKHVLIEKPLANTEEECLQLIEAAKQKGVTLMVAYVVRFRPEVQRLKEAIDREEYGKPFNAHCWIEGYIPPAPGSWFSSKEQLGGGVLFSHGCHYIDILQWLLGKPVEVAGLSTSAGTEWMEGDGTHHSLMKFESGALAHLVTSWGTKYKKRPALLHVHTPEACFIVDNNKLEVITEEGTKTLYEPSTPPKPHSRIVAQCEYFLNCIETGERPSIDGHEAMKSHRIIWEIEKHKGTPFQL